MAHVIVVGVDAREQSRDAVTLAAALAAQSAAEIVLAHVYPYDSLAYSVAIGGAAASALADESEALLREAADTAPVPVRTVALAAGSPARGLHVIADREGAELLVVGSSHRGPVARVMLGSHAESVLHDAPCAVAVAPRGLAAGTWSLSEITAAYDGSPEAREALATARRLAATSGASLRLFAVSPRLLTEWTAYSYEPDWRRVQVERTRWLEEHLASVAGGAATDVAVGEVVDELRKVTQETDLLVLGSRGYGAVRRVLLSATAHRVVRDAGCPVLVVPRSATPARATDEGTAESTTV